MAVTCKRYPVPTISTVLIFVLVVAVPADIEEHSFVLVQCFTGGFHIRNCYTGLELIGNISESIKLYLYRIVAVVGKKSLQSG